MRLARLLVGIALFAAACGSSAPPAPESTSPGATERDVSFETSDGKTLTGRLFGSGVAGVTLAHMFPADAQSWYPAAERLARAGYQALAFNFRGYGNSEGPKDVPRSLDDLKAAVAFLRTQGATSIVYAGASMGGTASLEFAASDPPSAVIAVSAPLKFMGLDALTNASKLRIPILLLAAQGDGPAFESLQELAREAPDAKTSVFDGEAHGTNLLTDRPEALTEMLTFLENYAIAQGGPTP